jgi:dihydroflavonol-4-reductase
MRVFVTGSTGLVGSNLVRQLVAAGHSVRALARSPEKARAQLAGLDVELVQGNLEHPETWDIALRGCDALFHTAAYFRESFGPGNHQARLAAVNVAATLDLFALAAKAGVRTIVHTSSAGAVGRRSDGLPSDEDTPPDGMALRNPYFRSKVEGDRAIAVFAANFSGRLVSVLPAWIFGPGDAAPTSGGRLVLDVLNGRLPALLAGSSDVVDARDVAAAMLAAAERGRSGSRYLVTAGHLALTEIAAEIAQVAGMTAPPRVLPTPLALVLATFAEGAAAVTGQASALTRDSVRMMAERKQVSAAKAQAELGVSFRPFAATVRDSVAWYLQHQPDTLPAPLRTQLQARLAAA